MFDHTPHTDALNGPEAQQVRIAANHVKIAEEARLAAMSKAEVHALAKAKWPDDTTSKTTKAENIDELSDWVMHGSEPGKALIALEREADREKRIERQVREAERLLKAAQVRLANKATVSDNWDTPGDAIDAAVELRIAQMTNRLWQRVVLLANESRKGPVEATRDLMAILSMRLVETVSHGGRMSSSASTNVLDETERRATAEWILWADQFANGR